MFHRLVFDFGVEAEFDNPKGWFLSLALEAGRTHYANILELKSFLKLKPVLGIHQLVNGDHSLIFDKKSNRVFGYTLAELVSRKVETFNLYDCYRVQYTLASMTYHCVKLAEAYAKICWHFTRVSRDGEDQPRAVFGHQPEPYYVFEAFLSAARNVYRIAQFAIWKRWRNGDPPDDFTTCVSQSKGMPEALRVTLLESWEKHGRKLKDYRDCFHHYDPMDAWLGSVFMKRVPGGVWSTLVRIPDNPENRTRKKFTFNQDLDALTYARDTLEELYDVMKGVMEVEFPEGLIQSGDGVN